FTGQAGGAIADLAGLIGEGVAVGRAPITFTVDGGKGRLVIGGVAGAHLIPHTGATRKPTSLSEAPVSTVPGSPGHAPQGSYFTGDGSRHGMSKVDTHGNNALQGHFRFAA